MPIKPFRLQSPDEGGEIPVLSAMDRRIAPRLFTRERVTIGMIAALALIVGAYGYVRFGLTSTIAVDAERLTIATVARGVFRDYVPLTGNVVPRTTVYLDAVAGGQVAQRLVEEGAIVAAGQSLVVLKNADLQLDVMGREASLTQQLFQLTELSQSLDADRLQRASTLADIEYQIRSLSAQLVRKRPLLAQGAIAPTEIEDMDLSLARYRREEENVSQAQKTDDATRPQQMAQLKKSIALITDNLAMSHQNLDALTIRAPIGGQLTLLDAEIGAAKTVGQRIGQIDSADGFKVRADVDEFYLARVATGQRATAEIDGRTYALTVAKIYPGVKDRQFAVDLAFRAQPPAIHGGQTLNLKLEIGDARDSLMVANGAFREDSGGQFVFALSPGGGVATRRPVTLGRYNPDAVEVLTGLAPGDRIVTSSYAPYLKFDRIDIHGSTPKGDSQP